MNLGELTARIGADTSQLKAGKIEANFLYNSIGNSAARMEETVKQSWGAIVGYSGLVIGAIYSMTKAFQEFENAAKTRDMKLAFENLAKNVGSNSERIISSLQRASGGTIDFKNAMQSASRAILYGLDPDTIVRLMEIARATTKVTGQSVVVAFEDITLGVARQSKMILDNLGILLDYDKHLGKIQTTLGKTEADLTDADRRVAFLNATFEAGDEIIRKVGDSFGTTFDKIAQQKAQIADVTLEIKNMVFESETYLNILSGISASLQQIKGLGDIWKFITFEKSDFGDLFGLIGGDKVIGFFKNLKTNVDGWENSLVSANPTVKTFVNYLRQIAGLSELGVIPIEKLSDRIKNLQFKFPVEFGFMKTFEKEVDQVLAGVDNKIKRTNSLLRAMGTTTKEGFAFKTSELQKEAEGYRNAKVDDLLVDKWYYGEVKKSLQSFVNYRSSLYEKIKEEDIVTAAEIKKTYEDMYNTLGFNSKKYYDSRLSSLNEQREKEIEITGDITLAWQAYYARLKELDNERIRHSGSAMEGIKLFFEEEARAPQSWASEAETAMGSFKDAMENGAFSIVRNTEDISGAFRNMATSVLDSMAKIGTNMMVNALFSAVGGMIGGAVAGAGTSTIGASYTGGAGSTISSGGGVNYNGMTGMTGYSRNTQPAGNTITNYYQIDATDADSFAKMLKRNSGVLNAITVKGKQKSRNFAKSMR